MNRHKLSMYMGVFALVCVFAMPFISNAQSARPTPEERLRMRLEPRAAAEAARIEDMIARYCETYVTHHMAWGTPIPDFCDGDGDDDEVPTVNLSLNPTSITAGGTSTLSWSSSDADTCMASGGWSGSKALSGLQNVSPTATTTYILACTGDGGTASTSVTLPVTPLPVGGGTTTLSLDFSAMPTTTPAGGNVLLSWTSGGATSCTASGGWSGSQNLTGTTTVTPATTTSYTLLCQNGAASISKSTTVNVTPTSTPTTTPVTLDFSVSPTTTPSGGSGLLSWTSTNATNCTASGGWSGAKALMGTTTVTPSTTTSYSLDCSNGGSSTMKTVMLEITATSTPTTTPQLLITEVYYDVASTSKGSDPANEWVEIYNPSNSAFDMTGFTVSDENATDTLPAGTIIPAQGYLFIVASSTTAGFWSFPVDAMVVNLSSSIGNGLTNTGDSLFLRDVGGNILDSLSWGDGDAAFVPSIPLPNPSDGISLRRINGFSDTDTNDGWEFGDPPTPGS